MEHNNNIVAKTSGEKRKPNFFRKPLYAMFTHIGFMK